MKMSLKDKARGWSKDRVREEIQDRRDSLAAYVKEAHEMYSEWFGGDHPPPPVPFTNPHLEKMGELRREIEYLKSLL